jgi:glucuronide carrier protein
LTLEQLVEGDLMRDNTANEAVAHKPVVTIFEQYGAGANYIGDRVAKVLGLPFYSQAFSSEQIEGGQEAATEEAALLARVYSVMGGAYGGFEGRDVAMTQQDRYELIMGNNRQVWAEAHDGGVILGRNATVILAQRPNTLHLLLTGSVEERVARAAQESGISPERAAARQRREDEVRAEMSISLYGWDPRLPDRYDLVINTSRISLDSAVDAIVALVGAPVA